MSSQLDRDICEEERHEAVSFFFIGFGAGCILATIILAIAGVSGWWVAGGVITGFLAMLAGGWASACVSEVAPRQFWEEYNNE